MNGAPPLAAADLTSIVPSYQFPSLLSSETPHVQSLIKTLKLETHIEGGYFVQTDASPITIPSPYPRDDLSDTAALVSSSDASNSHGTTPHFTPDLRRFSTTIFYYLSPMRPLGTFHKNRSRIIHTHHRGRGRYVLIHPPSEGRPARVETFLVGSRVEEGEKLQWVVEGGVWKASFLLDEDGGSREDNQGLLISETVVPGFEYSDHAFLALTQLKEMLPTETADKLAWLARKET